MSQTKCSQVPADTPQRRPHTRVLARVRRIGGAPLTSGTNYGYTVVSRNSDGSLTVGTFDYSTGSTIDSFKLKADGTAD